MFPSRSLRCVCKLAVAWIALSLSSTPLAATVEDPVPSPSGPVLVGRIVGPIGPATGIYVERLLREAADGDARALVLAIDTPGGLADTMRDIIQDILASPVPVVTFVHPEGARAASAGALIALAAHVSAMAPGTNIGAAHPVSIAPGGEQVQDDHMDEKLTNDAAAYARSIAARRGRNVEWAERIVRDSISSTADEALTAGVIDFIAGTLAEVIQRLEGRVVEVTSVTGEDEADRTMPARPGVPTLKRTIHTDGAAIIEVPPTLREKFLARISEPNIAYLLMLAGMFGLIFELQNPGSVFPGVVGALSLLMAAFALQMLPVNWAGASLIVLAIILFILEVKVTSHGLLTIGAVVAMLFGSLMLIDSPFPFMRVSLAVIIPSVIFTALFFLFAVGMGVRAQRRRVTTGNEGLVGMEGVTHGRVDVDGGSVMVRGEFWNAVCEEPLADGVRVEVIRVDGLRVRVRRAQPR